MRKRKTAVVLLFLTGFVALTSSAAASCHSGWGCSDDRRGQFDSGHDRGYSSGYDHSHDRGGLFDSKPQNYERGGLAHDYFHTDQFFGREIRGFPDTMFGEDSRYDARRSSDRGGHHNGLSRQEYNNRYDSGSYGAYSSLALRYGEGFVSGEGFGDEYIGDPDQLNERVHIWSR